MFINGCQGFNSTVGFAVGLNPSSALGDPRIKPRNPTITHANIIIMSPTIANVIVLLALSSLALSPAEVIHRKPPYKVKSTAAIIPTIMNKFKKELIALPGAFTPEGIPAGVCISRDPLGDGIFNAKYFIFVS